MPISTLLAENPLKDVTKLVGLLEKQCLLYTQLKALGDRQSQIVDQDTSDGLLAVLGQRRQLMDRLAVVNEDFEPYRKEWSSCWAVLGDSDKQQVGGLLKQVQQTLAAIIEQDEHDRRRLEQSKDRLASEMGKIAHTSTAVRAYRVPPTLNSRFTDRQG
jgi:hypothetical protein